MMTERRYGFRFNGMEGGMLLGGMLLASFLIFVSGVYVGREVAGRKGAVQTQVVRVPVSAFADPTMTAKSTAPNETPNTRTVAVNAPLTWPVAKEKVVPPVSSVPSSIAKPEETQQREREKVEPATHDNAPVTPVNVPRTVPSLSVKKDVPPPRTKPVMEPFAPKIPVAVASRSERSEKAAVPQSPRVEAKVSVVQNPRVVNEGRKPIAQNPRNEMTEKKPPTVTVATVEKIEAVTRPRVPAPEGKRVDADKSTEMKPALAATKKPPKQLAGWRVQVGATTYQETAHDMARELRELGYDPMVSKVQMNGETLYRVRIGKFGKQGEAVAAVGRFRREGRFSQAYLVSE